MKEYPIYIDRPWQEFDTIVRSLESDKIFIITDSNTRLHCLPILVENVSIQFESISIPAGEDYKSLNTTTDIWSSLLDKGCTRQSLVINLGGGVIGDMGGFSAATYMRGVRFIQMPTSLLSMVDASIGGKLGIDFKGIKNILGSFNNPECVWINTTFLDTLPEEQYNSGFAEIIKHSLISESNLWNQINDDSSTIGIGELIERNIAIKQDIVKQDPKEAGIRKVLNYGHTIGHGLESYFLSNSRSLLHGYAVAYGMMLENELSVALGHLSNKDCNTINAFIAARYLESPLKLSKDAINEVVSIMRSDKKNTDDVIRCSLLESPGKCLYNIAVKEATIIEVMTASEIITA